MAVALKNATPGDLMRLDSIASHLDLRSDPGDLAFEREAVEAVLRQAAPIVKRAAPTCGEDLLSAVADHFGVTFEEVRDLEDIASLKKRYLKQRGELGFELIDDELADAGVDALLFQLTKPRQDRREKFIAVLNLQASESRGYWNRSHELSHRLAEPPQKLLPFKRHRIEAANPVERLIDQIAGALAFYAPLFGPLVAKEASSVLDLETVLRVQRRYARSSSLLAAANASADHWPRPALVLTASVRGKKNAKRDGVALRAMLQARNGAARAEELLIWNNMRVPKTSPLFAAFHENRQCEGYENLAAWASSDGHALANIRVFTSALGLGDSAYAVMSRE